MGATIFSKFDVNSAYNQVPVAEEEIQKTVFVTKYGLFEFITIPFGLMTVPHNISEVDGTSTSRTTVVTVLDLSR